MPEICLKSKAERIASLAGRSPVETVLGAFPPAGKIEPAFHTLRRKARTLGDSEPEPLGIVVDIHEWFLKDVPEKIFRIDEMVAIVDVPVVFDHKAVPAGLAHGTDTWLGIAILCKGGIEQLDEIVTNIGHHPFIEYIA